VWIKKVVDCIEKARLFDIKKVSNARISKTYKFPYVFDILALWKGVFCRPNIAILDTYGEAAIWMWILLRLFRRDTKIVTIFHHYEPLSIRHKECKSACMKYYHLVDSITKIMLRNSDKIITVSNSSLRQLETAVQIRDTKKIINVGCSCGSYYPINSNGKKDIDFLCVGRLEKFDRIERIWATIKKKTPSSRFIMIGRATSEEKIRLRVLGIDHRGVVSETEKIKLYGRAKVFIFPSLFEGFGLAITEAILAGLSIVAWRIPVFEERFQDRPLNNGGLVETGNYELFAEKAIKAVEEYDKWIERSKGWPQEFFTKSWDDVGSLVVNALNNFHSHTSSTNSSLVRNERHLIK
jgi:glycosyltransferase involved in cell wall biosynthesis